MSPFDRLLWSPATLFSPRLLPLSLAPSPPQGYVRNQEREKDSRQHRIYPYLTLHFPFSVSLLDDRFFAIAGLFHCNRVHPPGLYVWSFGYTGFLPFFDVSASLFTNSV